MINIDTKFNPTDELDNAGDNLSPWSGDYSVSTPNMCKLFDDGLQIRRLNTNDPNAVTHETKTHQYQKTYSKTFTFDNNTCPKSFDTQENCIKRKPSASTTHIEIEFTEKKQRLRLPVKFFL